jgi:hypothetical protein
MKEHFQSVIASDLCPTPPVERAVKGKITVEFAKFIIKEGVTDTHVIAASQNFEDNFLVQQSGYLKRDLLHIKGREWADIVYWANSEEAEKALLASQKNPACGEYFSIMEQVDPLNPNCGITHLEVVKSYSVFGKK